MPNGQQPPKRQGYGPPQQANPHQWYDDMLYFKNRLDNNAMHKVQEYYYNLDAGRYGERSTPTTIPQQSYPYGPMREFFNHQSYQGYHPEEIAPPPIGRPDLWQSLFLNPNYVSPVQDINNMVSDVIGFPASVRKEIGNMMGFYGPPQNPKNNQIQNSAQPQWKKDYPPNKLQTSYNDKRYKYYGPMTRNPSERR